MYSGFMKGPWGPKTLCVVHYVAWFRTKKLDLSDYVRNLFDMLYVAGITNKAN